MYWNRINRSWDSDSKVHCINFLCMKGKERGGGVANEESNGGVAYEESRGGNAIYRGPPPVCYAFVLVHRSNARADGRVNRATLGPMESACEQRSMQRKEIGGGVAEDDDDESGDEINQDDDGDDGGNSDGDDDESGLEGGLAGVVCVEKGRG
ncbi:hypothetical protein Syun_002177 [Stephania yunnanensis]|uniref:Uncharacterized protein n=1 Tax=Stephania yunnanensis TaxID=152371 RepID=A0AAP0LEX6_9MAGN